MWPFVVKIKGFSTRKQWMHSQGRNDKLKLHKIKIVVFFIQHVVLWRVFRHELRHYDVTGRNNILVGPPVIDEMIELIKRLFTDRNLFT